MVVMISIIKSVQYDDDDDDEDGDDDDDDDDDCYLCYCLPLKML